MNASNESAKNGNGAGAGSYGIPLPQATKARSVASHGGRGTAGGTSLGRVLARASLILLLVFAGGIAGGALGGCVTTPITGKKAILPFPASYDVQLGLQALDEYVDQSKVVTSGRDSEMVQRVMDRLVVAAGEDGAGYEWSVRLIDEPDSVNAFALPGGPMAVYTGILPVTATETGLAVVMGHELGHVLARHGMQRVTRTQGTSLVLQMFEMGEWAQLAQLGYQFAVELPFGRGDESEADHIGLILMARAGYDPREAPRFWERMAEMSGGGGGPEWMSTHPSHETRQEDLKALLPEAMEEFRPGGQDEGDGGLKQFEGR